MLICISEWTSFRQFFFSLFSHFYSLLVNTRMYTICSFCSFVHLFGLILDGFFLQYRNEIRRIFALFPTHTQTSSPALSLSVLLSLVRLWAWVNRTHEQWGRSKLQQTIFVWIERSTLSFTSTRIFFLSDEPTNSNTLPCTNNERRNETEEKKRIATTNEWPVSRFICFDYESC